jgi:hypothetical protein
MIKNKNYELVIIYIYSKYINKLNETNVPIFLPIIIMAIPRP